MPDAFFASTRKRKRAPSTDRTQPSSSKKPVRTQAQARTGAPGAKTRPSAPAMRGRHTLATRGKRRPRDEELSDQTPDDDEDGAAGVDELDLRAPDVDPTAYESGEEDEQETEAEKRLRLAKLYIKGVKEGLSLGA